MGQREIRITGRHVFIAFAVFFGIVFAANAAMITLAVTTFTGEDVRAAYGTGLRYNDVLKAKAQTRDLGWIMDVELDRTNGLLTVHLSADEASPAKGLNLEGRLERPVQSKLDRELVFRETGPGVYSAPIAALAPGQWDLVVRAELLDGRIFQAERRI